MNFQPETNNEETFADRLKVALNQRSGRSVATKAGLSPSVFSQYATGKNLPSLRHLIALSKSLGVKIEWLATGEGPMRADSPTEPPTRGKPKLMMLDTSALGVAMKHVEQMEEQTGTRFDAEGRAAAIAGLYLALMRDRENGKPDPE